MDKLKKKANVKGKAPESYLYEKTKKEKKVTDKDLFVMSLKRENKNKK
tara:strand:- start:398 stop:541 length:144 start_codon:yes stop_codon:yes gene_type:complete